MSICKILRWFNEEDLTICSQVEESKGESTFEFDILRDLDYALAIDRTCALRSLKMVQGNLRVRAAPLNEASHKDKYRSVRHRLTNCMGGVSEQLAPPSLF